MTNLIYKESILPGTFYFFVMKINLEKLFAGFQITSHITLNVLEQSSALPATPRAFISIITISF